MPSARSLKLGSSSPLWSVPPSLPFTWQRRQIWTAHTRACDCTHHSKLAPTQNSVMLLSGASKEARSFKNKPGTRRVPSETGRGSHSNIPLQISFPGGDPSPQLRCQETTGFVMGQADTCSHRIPRGSQSTKLGHSVNYHHSSMKLKYLQDTSPLITQSLQSNTYHSTSCHLASRDTKRR